MTITVIHNLQFPNTERSWITAHLIRDSKWAGGYKLVKPGTDHSIAVAALIHDLNYSIINEHAISQLKESHPELFI